MVSNRAYMFLARKIVPRWLRNLLRRPLATARWFGGELAFLCGKHCTITLENDWTVKCHPVCKENFLLHAQVEDFRTELEAFVEKCHPGMTLLDIGANYGIFSLAAVHYGGLQAQVIAVDPSPVSNRLLQANLKLNDAIQPVQIIEAAIGTENGSQSMLSTGPAGQFYYVASGDKRNDAATVRQLTISSVVKSAGLIPSHVKIDVEGSEEDVLRGGADFFRSHHPLIFLELHGTMLRERGQDPQGVLTLLGEYGYSFFEWKGKPIAPSEAARLDIARLVCLPEANDR